MDIVHIFVVCHVITKFIIFSTRVLTSFVFFLIEEGQISKDGLSSQKSVGPICVPLPMV